jgi:hypothetical protein
MEHEANGLVLIFLGEASACRQDGSLRLLSAACLSNCLQDRERSMTSSSVKRIVSYAGPCRARNSEVSQSTGGDRQRPSLATAWVISV